ncbi:uncharacterized protein F4812DRAFT_313931 [Daldinia caldariorum]|uniref:uncharacterized protein n=1 Tax=Daldinia caldariorum TaxID=326644 RepID=UPI002008A94C|nr:uncharacterized protein F4812DRAFT_313931 [Daldinia caldariorum]KAI1470097.1 hypothetical protein F4812DRAFT_313931 [Daldinia caldariorum]
MPCRLRIDIAFLAGCWLISDLSNISSQDCISFLVHGLAQMPWTDSLTSRQDIRRRRPISSNQSFIPLPYYEATACSRPRPHQRDYSILPTPFGDNPSLFTRPQPAASREKKKKSQTWGFIRFYYRPTPT